MSPEVEARIRGYRPRRDRAERWEDIRPLVLELVELSDPPTAKNASSTMSAITTYVLWAESKGLPLQVENLANHKIIDWHLTEAAYGEATEATYRPALDRMVAAPRPGGAGGRRRPVLPPYSETEQAQLLRLVTHQPTEASAVRVETLLRAGLGAGAQAVEQRHLQPDDISRAGEITTVRLGEGADRRMVPALSDHGERLAELADEGRRLGLTYLVSGNGSPDRVNAISQLAADINGSADAPRLVASRLRTTWLVTHLRARTPFDLLIPAAGPVTPQRLAELLVHVDDVDEDERRRILAQADQAHEQGWRHEGGGR